MRGESYVLDIFNRGWSWFCYDQIGSLLGLDERAVIDCESSGLVISFSAYFYYVG